MSVWVCAQPKNRKRKLIDYFLDIADYPERPQKERILKIAAQLFAKRGFHAVGMSDLQDAVKLGRDALYHHIRSKEDLLCK